MSIVAKPLHILTHRQLLAIARLDEEIDTVGLRYTAITVREQMGLSALSGFYLDQHMSYGDYVLIARQLVEYGISNEKVEGLYTDDLFPALWFNLASTAGV